MSGLLSALNTAGTALQVFSSALGNEQINIANASTPGFAALRSNILPIGSAIGGGNSGDFISVSSSGSALSDAQVQSASSEASLSSTTASLLSPINQLFDITGSSGILAALQQFNTAFSALSVTPNDATLGAQALSAAGGVASAFRSVASSLNQQRSETDAAIQSTVSQINSLAGDIRRLNVQQSQSAQFNPTVDASLRSDLDQLSSLVDVTVSRDSGGSVTVLAGGQLPLVIGSQAYTLSADPTATPGSQVTSTAGGGSPSTFSGQLGALLNTSNGTLNQLLGSGTDPGTLNTLAEGFAARVNTLLSSGTTTSGATGTPIFSYDTTNPANAAGSLSLISSVTAGQLGLSGGATGSSNGIANQLAALPSSVATADQIGGQSAESYFGTIAATVGQQLSDANSASTSDQNNLTAAQSARQQSIGVSLDQEAVSITALQRSYEANAQVVSILNQLTDTEVNLIK